MTELSLGVLYCTVLYVVIAVFVLAYDVNVVCVTSRFQTLIIIFSVLLAVFF